MTGSSVNFGVDEQTGELPRCSRVTQIRCIGGLPLEFSTLYLTNRFTPGKLPKREPVNQLVPLIEFAFNSPRGEKTSATMNPGLSYVTTTWQLAAEAIVPLNKEAGRSVGARAQLLLFLDELNSLAVRETPAEPITHAISQAIRTLRHAHPLAALSLLAASLRSVTVRGRAPPTRRQSLPLRRPLGHAPPHRLSARHAGPAAASADRGAERTLRRTRRLYLPWRSARFAARDAAPAGRSRDLARCRFVPRAVAHAPVRLGDVPRSQAVAADARRAAPCPSGATARSPEFPVLVLPHDFLLRAVDARSSALVLRHLSVARARLRFPSSLLLICGPRSSSRARGIPLPACWAWSAGADPAFAAAVPGVAAPAAAAVASPSPARPVADCHRGGRARRRRVAEAAGAASRRNGLRRLTQARLRTKLRFRPPWRNACNCCAPTTVAFGTCPVPARMRGCTA